MKKPRVLLLVFALSAALPAASLGFSSVDPRLGVILIPTPTDLRNASGHLAGDAPVLTNFLGIGTTMKFSGFFSWAPALDFYWAYHLWSPENNRALPAEISYRTSFTMAFLVQSPILLTLPVTRDWEIGIGLGPAFNLRYALLANLTPAEVPLASLDIPKINAYFYGDARWFLPETLLRVSYRLSERMDFSLSALGFWPVFNLWKGSGMPLDEGIFGGEIGVRARL